MQLISGQGELVESINSFLDKWTYGKDKVELECEAISNEIEALAKKNIGASSFLSSISTSSIDSKLQSLQEKLEWTSAKLHSMEYAISCRKEYSIRLLAFVQECFAHNISVLATGYEKDGSGLYASGTASTMKFTAESGRYIRFTYEDSHYYPEDGLSHRMQKDWVHINLDIGEHLIHAERASKSKYGAKPSEEVAMDYEHIEFAMRESLSFLLGLTD